MFLTLTFKHEVETIKGLRDFEKIIAQAIYSKNRIENWLQKYKLDEDVSNVSSLNIYKHTTTNLSIKSIPLKTIQLSIKDEKRLLDLILNNKL